MTDSTTSVKNLFDGAMLMAEAVEAVGGPDAFAKVLVSNAGDDSPARCEDVAGNLAMAVAEAAQPLFELAAVGEAIQAAGGAFAVAEAMEAASAQIEVMEAVSAAGGALAMAEALDAFEQATNLRGA